MSTIPNSSSSSLNKGFNASYVLLRPNYLPVSHLNPPLRPFYPSIRPPDPDAMGTTEDVELEVISPETCGTIPLEIRKATVALERTFVEGLPLLTLSLNNLYISFN
eukprot:TRINITY_DN7243_c0_g1_i11.p2 TRINITY_DN7243_c0_g1~~TRINITY_DN7243_c0_g1_i11.p2  ORF type:complete len:106 (-),score=2.19 TRINITY_DN7243_c0_g1_i11:865-1182(-)